MIRLNVTVIKNVSRVNVKGCVKTITALKERNADKVNALLSIRSVFQTLIAIFQVSFVLMPFVGCLFMIAVWESTVSHQKSVVSVNVFQIIFPKILAKALNVRVTKSANKGNVKRKRLILVLCADFRRNV